MSRLRVITLPKDLPTFPLERNLVASVAICRSLPAAGLVRSGQWRTHIQAKEPSRNFRASQGVHEKFYDVAFEVSGPVAGLCHVL